MAWEDPRLLGALAVAGALALAAWIALCVRRRRRRSVAVPGAAGRASWMSGLAQTRGTLARRLLEAWSGPDQADAWLAHVEEILLSADVGVKATRALLERLRPGVRAVGDVNAVRALLKSAVCELVGDGAQPSQSETKPAVVLVVGVNGVGKTTTIGKLAYRYGQQGQKVLLVAADTFRAAAIEQLAVWAERVGAGLVKHQPGADPAAVAFDGVQAAVARGVDVVIVDTAGRLHVKTNLMEEVKKIARTVGRQVPGAPHQVLLVIDATTGQNALNQARVFHEALGVTGVVLTKLDGTAKGGVALAIRGELSLPIRYVGLGEGAADLAPFDPDAFAAALFPESELGGAA